MMTKLGYEYILSADEVRDLILTHLANQNGFVVPSKFSDAVITWGRAHEVSITFNEQQEAKIL